jgi:tRNA threonylcarbamoyladenosine biosynthesis protein TsaB
MASSFDRPLLAFDTGTDVLSVALRLADGRVLARSGPGGAAASSSLIPTVMDLLAEAGIAPKALGAIVFGQGPGSFTGLRTACAVAQGLAYGAGVKVVPVPSLLAVAEDARMRHGAEHVLATLDARMDEVYFAAYQWSAGDVRWRELASARVAAPEDVAFPAEGGDLAREYVLAGNARAIYGDRLAPHITVSVSARPSAEALLSLAPGLIAAGLLLAPAGALPLYVRDKVARTTTERDADRLARAAAAVGAV